MRGSPISMAGMVPTCPDAFLRKRTVTIPPALMSTSRLDAASTGVLLDGSMTLAPMVAQGIMDMPFDIAGTVVSRPGFSALIMGTLAVSMKSWNDKARPWVAKKLDTTPEQLPELGPILMTCGILHALGSAIQSSGSSEDLSKPLGAAVVTAFFLSAVLGLKHWANQLERNAKEVPDDQRAVAEKRIQRARLGQKIATYTCLVDDILPVMLLLETLTRYAQKIF